jgi:hypothetical protein
VLQEISLDELIKNHSDPENAEEINYSNPRPSGKIFTESLDYPVHHPGLISLHPG